MPAHDWTRVTAGTFHDFLMSWIIHLKETLNAGLLPEGYYALAEQHAGDVLPDVLTLAMAGGRDDASGGGVALAEAPPKVAVRMRLSESAAYREGRRTLVIRHRSGRRIVAMVEIVSPANKDRDKHVDRLVRKAESALQHGIHLLVIDLLPPGRWDPRGINGAIWEGIDGGEFELPPDKPLTLASYLCDGMPEAFIEPLAVGDPLPEMPLFLDIDRYVNVPLEKTYTEAYVGVPAILCDAIEGRVPAET